MTKEQLKASCRRRGLAFESETNVTELKDRLAPRLRREFLNHKPEGDLGDVWSWIRSAARGDLSMVDAVGALATFASPNEPSSDDDDDGDRIPLFTPASVDLLPELAPLDDAVPPDGFRVVPEPPPLAEITKDGGNFKIKKLSEYKAFLGTAERPTTIMVFFDGTTSSGERQGWYVGHIVAPARNKPWNGLAYTDKQLREGCNYRVVFDSDCIEAIALNMCRYSTTPVRGHLLRSWVMVEPLDRPQL